MSVLAHGLLVLFLRERKSQHSCESSAQIHIKCQDLFSLKNKTKIISKCCLL